MKIIKQGKKPIKRKQQKCSNCDCIFEYERSDIKSDNGKALGLYALVARNVLVLNGFKQNKNEQD